MFLIGTNNSELLYYSSKCLGWSVLRLAVLGHIKHINKLLIKTIITLAISFCQGKNPFLTGSCFAAWCNELVKKHKIFSVQSLFFAGTTENSGRVNWYSFLLHSKVFFTQKRPRKDSLTHNHRTHSLLSWRITVRIHFRGSRTWSSSVPWTPSPSSCCPRRRSCEIWKTNRFVSTFLWMRE